MCIYICVYIYTISIYIYIYVYVYISFVVLFFGSQLWIHDLGLFGFVARVQGAEFKASGLGSGFTVWAELGCCVGALILCRPNPDFRKVFW